MTAKYTTINGWTKATMKAAIRAGNNGKKAYDESSSRCEYLTLDGNRCAIGCFIPEGHAAQHCPLGVWSLIEKHTNLNLPLGGYGLSYLQAVHDNFSSTTLDVRDALDAWIEANVEDGP